MKQISTWSEKSTISKPLGASVSLQSFTIQSLNDPNAGILKSVESPSLYLSKFYEANQYLECSMKDVANPIVNYAKHY